jgi:uncharacterized protein YbaP (TraB family)
MKFTGGGLGVKRLRIGLMLGGLVLVAAATLLVCAPAARAASNYRPGGSHKNFLWKVQSKSNTVYVLGSVHAGTKELYPLAPDIEEAFNGSASLAVEADIDPGNLLRNGETLQKSLLESIMYPEGDILERHVSKETYGKLDAELRKLGASIEELKIFRPWFLAAVIETARYSGEGLSPEYGIDRHFLLEAEGRKPILELEGITYQFDIFRRLTDREQELFLQESMDSSAETDPEKLLTAWASGDTSYMESSLEKDLRDHPEQKSIFDKFFFERNRGMAEKIEGYLAGHETVFVVVGAGHLVGSRGIIQILKDKGYSVEQVATGGAAAPVPAQ